MRIASSAAVVLTLSLSISIAPGCFLFGKKVSKDDCDRWATQYEKVVKAAGDKACKGNKDGAKSFKKTLSTDKDGRNTACATQAGTGALAIPKADDDCYMNASKIADWKKCNFAATSPLFVWGGTPDASEATFAGCSGGDDDDTQKASKGDDDDSTKSKKKKKTGDDDDNSGGW